MSQTIDSRVVEMKFDNSNFESNVSQSMSTLDKLKSALKFEGASDGLESVSKAAKNVDVSGIGSAVDEVGVKFSSLQVIGTTALANITNSAVNCAKNMVSSVVSAVGEGGLTRALNLEQANFMFEGLGMDATKAMESCNEAVEGTAYALDQAAMAAAQFGATGMDAGDEMTSALRGIAGVAAMTGSEYSDIAQIFTTVAGNGRLMADQLNQLGYRGINAAAILAEQWNISEEELRKMVSAGEVSFKDFYTAMDEAFGEHAKDANETYTGALANMKTAAARIGADFFTPVLESSRKLFNAFTPVIDAIHTGLNPAIESLTGFIDTCFSKLRILLGNLENGGIDAFFADLYDKFSLSDTAAQNLNYTMTGLYSIFQLVGQIVGAVANVFSELASFIAPAVLAITAPIGELLTYINNFVQRWNIFGKIGDSIVSVLDTLKNAFGEIWTTLTGKFDIFSLVGQFFDGLDEFMSSTDFNIFETIANGISDCINGIKDTILEFIDFIPDDFLVNVIGAPFALFGLLLNAVGIDVSSFGSFLSSTISVVEKATTKVGEFIRSFINLPQVQSVISSFDGVFESTFNKLGEFFTGLVYKVNDFIDGLKSMDSISLNDISTVLGDFKTKVLDYFGGLGDCFSDLKEAASQFIGSFKNGLSDAIGTIERFINSILNIAETIGSKLNFNFGSILTVGVGAAVIYIVKQIGNLYGSISTIFGAIEQVTRSIGLAAAKVERAVSNMINAAAFKEISKGVRMLAESVGILALSLIALAQIDVKDLEKAGAALGSLAGGLIILVGAITAIGKISGGKAGEMLNGVFFIEIAGSVLILAAALKVLESIDAESMFGSLTALVLILVGLTASIKSLNKTGGGFAASAGTIIAMAASILIMAEALKQLSSMDFGDIVKSLIALGAIIGLLESVIKSMSKASVAGGKFSLGSSVGIIGVVVAMELLISELKRIADMKPADLVVGLVGMGLLIGYIDIVLKAFGKAGANALSAGVGILAISAAFLVISKAIESLGELDAEIVNNAIHVITQISIFFAGFIAISDLAGENSAKAGVMLLAMSASLLILSGVMVILSSLDPSGLGRATGALAVVMAVFALMIAATSLVSKESTQMKTTLTAMTVAIAVLAICIGALAMLDPSGLGRATAAIAIVMAVFGACIAATGLAKSAVSSVAIITVALVAVTACLALLGDMNPESVLASAAGLSLVLLAISAALVIVGTIKGISGEAMGAIAILALIMAGLAGVLYLLNGLDADTAMAMALSLSTMMLAISAALVIVTAVGAMSGFAYAGMAAFALFVVEMGVVLIALGGLADEIKPLMDKAIPILEEFGTALGTTIGNIVSGFLSAATSSLEEVGDNLSGFMQHMSGFIEGAQSIDGSVVSGIDNLCEALVKLGAADFINAVEEFLAPGTDDNFASLGAKLQNIGGALTDFYGSMATINNMDRLVLATQAAQQMADMVKALPTNAELNKSILTGDMGEFSSQMENFGAGLSSFSSSLGDANLDKVKEAGEIGQALSDLNNSLPDTGGAFQEWFFGGKDLTAFSSGIETFADAISGMADSLGDTNLDNVVRAGEIGQALSDLQNSLPDTGGVLQEWFFGGQDLNTFSSQIQIFATAIHNMAACLEGVSLDNVVRAGEVGQALSDLNNSLPETGGGLQFLLGEVDLNKFSSGIQLFAVAIHNMAASLGDTDLSPIDNAAKAGESLSKLCEALPSSGGVLDSIFGGQEDLGTFSANLKDFGDALKNLALDTDGIEASSFDGIVDATNKLKDIEFPDFTSSGWASLTTGKDNISDFSGTLTTLAGAFVDYQKALGDGGFDSDKISSSTNAIVDVSSALSGISQIDEGSVSSFVTSLNDLSEISLDEFATSFSEAGPKITEAINSLNEAFSNADFSASITESLVTAFDTGIDAAVASISAKVTEAVSLIMSQFSMGISETAATYDFTQAFTSAIESSISTINGYGSQFYSSGLNIGEQFASGLASSISASGPKITEAASGLVSAFSAGISSSNTNISSTFDGIIKSALSSINGQASLFTTAGQTLITNLTSGAQSQNSKWVAEINTILNNAVKKISEYYKTFKSCGESLITNLANGIKAKSSSVSSAVGTAVSSGASKARGYYSSYYSAGSYLVSGLTKGIKDNASSATSAAYSLGKSAADAVKRGANENSPSKITFEAGMYIDLGLANGVYAFASVVNRACYAIGHEAAESMTEAVSSISSIVDTDMDINPTITPVIDLSNVESGAGRINALLSGNGVLGLAMNSAGWISGSMNSREDPNAEIISAIKKLGKDITNEPRSVTNNTVNGISYDNGSEIQSAIETLVHAAKIGGRT